LWERAVIRDRTAGTQTPRRAWTAQHAKAEASRRVAEAEGRAEAAVQEGLEAVREAEERAAASMQQLAAQMRDAVAELSEALAHERRQNSELVSGPFPSWNRSILTEIYLCHVCSCQEILRVETARQAGQLGVAGALHTQTERLLKDARAQVSPQHHTNPSWHVGPGLCLWWLCVAAPVRPTGTCAHARAHAPLN
jgi:phage-related tail protein